MKHHAPPPRPLVGLDDFAALMAATAQARTRAAAAILAGRPIPEEVQPELVQALADLEEAGDRDGRAELETAEDQSVTLDIVEETTQLENDVVYLEQGREALFKHLSRRHHGFRDAIKRGLRLVAGQSPGLLLVDGDGALREPGQRFVTAVQPVWNAVALGRFAQARVRRQLVFSAGPLSGPGLTDLLTMPPHLFACAASLGRQHRHADGREGEVPLSAQKAALLEAINARLAMLLADPSWRVFAFVGSGLQFCRGVTRVARQDALAGVDPEASLDLLEHIHDVVDAVDPERVHFRVEDNGLDVSIVPTAGEEDLSQPFTPAEGLRAVDAALDLGLGQGPVLACCGGASGLALLEALIPLAGDPRCLFVADREESAHRAEALCRNTVVVSHPDLVAAILSSAAP
jgi:hypothetical protein